MIKKLTLIALLNIALLLTLPFTSALSISNVRADDVNDRSAVVRWATDEAADSRVQFGKTIPDTSASNSLLTRDHSVALLRLDASTPYKFKVSSGSAVDDNNGAFYSFSTTADDTVAPRIDVNLPSIVNELKIDISGETEANAELRLYVGSMLVKTSVSTNGVINFADVRLDESENVLRIDAVDATGNSNSKTFNVKADVSAPQITLTEALPGVTEADTAKVKGTISEHAAVSIMVNGNSAFEQEAEAFDVTVNLDEGNNVIIVTATDAAGNSDRVEHTVLVDTQPPDIFDVQPLEEQPFYYEGRATDTVRGKTEPGAQVYLFVEYGGFGASAAVGSGGGVSGSYGQSGTPSADNVIERAQFKTTADGEGNFKFDDVNFQHPGGIEAVAPREVPAGTEGLGGTQRVSQLQQDVRTVRVFIAAVDGVAHRSVFDYIVDIGSCFSGNFDFAVKTLPGYQYPPALNPQRLDSGTEIISFVLDINYSGRAGNNRLDPNAPRIDDDYYEISSVTLERACGRADNDFFERNPAYQYACEITQNRPAVVQPMNPEGTKWFFRYNLGATDKFTDFNEDFWKKLLNNELKFPFKVNIDYEEKLIGREADGNKRQTMCREVSYFVDVPVDPRRVLPDFLLEDGQKAINDTLKAISEIMPVLDDVIHYVGVGCLSSFGLRTVVQWYRRAVQEWEFLKCKVPDVLGLDQCPVQDKEQLDACFTIKQDNELPYPPDARPPLDKWKCAEIKDEFEGQNVRRELSESPIMLKYFAGTVSAWKSEMSLFKAYRYLCDRHFCRAVPAKWTQTVDVGEINLKTFAQQQCAAETPSVSTLKRIENCWEELGEKQKMINAYVTDISQLASGNNVCYEYTGAIYRVAEINSPRCGEVAGGNGEHAHRLERIDNQQNIPEIGALETKPQSLCAIRVDNTYYTADQRSCEVRAASGEKSVCGSWDAKCTTKNDPAIIGWYPAGPTKGCWEGELNNQPGQQCYCRQKAVENENTKRDAIKKQGVAYAGTETGELTNAGGDRIGVDGSGGKWPWNYREWQIYEQTHQAGIYYPPERYYDKRDFPGAFGQNYLLDKFFGTRTPTVNPFTQDIGAVQGVCLTGIRARLRLLQSILLGLQNCLKSIETTGKADAGVCKEVFSQFVCNLAYKAVNLFENRCVPEPFSGALGKKEPDLKDALSVGSRALTDTLQQTQRELEDDYGNAQLNQYFEGGTQTLMKKVCLASFGIEAGLDFDGLIDGEYSAPFKSTATILSSEGAKGRREFLSFNPQNRNSIYEYRAAWLITAGCDLESYRIDLVAVKEDERRQFPNINCAEVNDQEGTGGCDNLRSGITVQPYPFSSGTRVAAGSYIDENKATNVESPYRYDHMKVTLFVDSRQDAKKCIPDENRQGDTGVFYFPVHDATGQDVLQCDLSPTDGKFLCQISGLSGLGQAYIENVQCYDPRIGDYTRCDRVTLTLEKKDLVKARVSVFSSGENKFCMNTYAQTTNAGNTELRQIEIPGIGRPGSIPFDVTLTEINSETFRGREEGISLINSFTTGVQPCNFDFETSNDIADKSKIGGGQTTIRFDRIKEKTPAQEATYKVTLGPGIDALTSGFQQNVEYTTTQLKGYSYRVRGYGIKEVVPLDSEKSPVQCTFNPQKPRQFAPQEQDWKLHFNLMYPDKISNACIANGAPLPSVPSLAFDTRKTETVRVRDSLAETAALSAYQMGKRLFNEAKGGSTAQRIQRYESAVAEFGRTWSNTAEGTKEEMLGYWWTVAAYAHLWKLKEGSKPAQDEIKSRLLGYADRFAVRLRAIQTQKGNFDATPPVNPLLSMQDIRLAKAYIGEIETAISEEKSEKVNTLQVYGEVNANCGECYEMEQAWTELFGAVFLIRNDQPKYFNPVDSVWVKERVYKDPTATSGAGGSSANFDTVRNDFNRILNDVIVEERRASAYIALYVGDRYTSQNVQSIVLALSSLKTFEERKLGELDALLAQVKAEQRGNADIQQARATITRSIDDLTLRITSFNAVVADAAYKNLRTSTITKLNDAAQEKTAAKDKLVIPSVAAGSGTPVASAPAGTKTFNEVRPAVFVVIDGLVVKERATADRFAQLPDDYNLANMGSLKTELTQLSNEEIAGRDNINRILALVRPGQTPDTLINDAVKRNSEIIEFLREHNADIIRTQAAFIIFRNEIVQRLRQNTRSSDTTSPTSTAVIESKEIELSLYLSFTSEVTSLHFKFAPHGGTSVWQWTSTSSSLYAPVSALTQKPDMMNVNYWAVIQDLQTNSGDYSHGIRVLVNHANVDHTWLWGRSSIKVAGETEAFTAEIDSTGLAQLIAAAKK